MTQYHIAASGKPARCDAQPGNCPLGGRHFGSKDEADFYTELNGSTAAVSGNISAINAARDQVSEVMEFGAIVRSIKGEARDVTIFAPMEYVDGTQYVDLDEDGSAPDPVAPKGWEYLKGFTGQQGYNGPIMHSSEQIGGRLADHILENPGYYTSVIIDGTPAEEDAESQPVGWGILHYVGWDNH